MQDAAPDHGHHDLTEVEEVLADDDPRTPVWLTALGGILFCAAFGWILVSQGPSAAATDAGSPSSAAGSRQNQERPKTVEAMEADAPKPAVNQAPADG